MICRIQKLLMIASLVMGCVAFAARADAQVDAATAQRARALIAAIQQSTAPIMDLTCTVQLTWSGVMWGGGEGREYLENRIRMFEIFKQRELLADARADKQIEDLKAVLNAPKAADSVVVTRWRTRRDGLFRMLRANSKADGTWSIYDHAFDGEQARAYVWESKQGVILKYTPGFSDPSPDFAWRVGAERLEAFIARALREGDVQISDAVAGDERYVKVIALAPPYFAQSTIPVFARAWLDPRKGLLPTIIEQGSVVGGTPADWLVTSVTIIEGKEILPGVWYPSAWIGTWSYMANLADADQPAEKWKLVAFPGMGVVQCRVSQIRVNQGLRKEAFTIEFPQQAEVTDTRHFKPREEIVR